MNHQRTIFEDAGAELYLLSTVRAKLDEANGWHWGFPVFYAHMTNFIRDGDHVELKADQDKLYFAWDAVHYIRKHLETK